jgi:hypothetical protein
MVIRRSRAQRIEAVARAARVVAITWLVVLRLDGQTETQGAFACPNAAQAAARDLRRGGFAAFTRMAS